MEKEKQQELAKQQEKIEQKMQEAREAINKMADMGELPKARAMTRRERRKLNDAGLNMRNFDFSNNTKNLSHAQEEMCDWILDNVYEGFNFDDLPNNICRIFAAYVLELTYKDEIAEKN